MASLLLHDAVTSTGDISVDLTRNAHGARCDVMRYKTLTVIASGAVTSATGAATVNVYVAASISAPRILAGQITLVLGVTETADDLVITAPYGALIVSLSAISGIGATVTTQVFVAD